MKKFGMLAVALGFLLAMTSCAKPQATETPAGGESESAAEFRVALECNYAPFNWTQTKEGNGAVPIDGGGFAGGYDVEIAKRLAEGLGKKLVIVKTEWDGLIPAVNAGKCDAVIAGMSPTAERKVSVDFSDPYYNSQLVVVVKKDGAFAGATSVKDFAGAKITGQLNTFHYSVIDQMDGVNKQPAMESFPAMIVALTSGKIDGYVSEMPGAVSAQTANPALAIVEFADGKGFEASEEDTAVAVAVKKGNAELPQINEVLKGISEKDREDLMVAAIANQPLSQ